MHVLYLGTGSVGVQFFLHAGAPGLFNGHTLPASRVAGGFRWNAQVNTGGSWKLQPGGGIVVYAKAFIEGPVCTHCGNNGSIANGTVTGYWRRDVYTCLKCNYVTDYRDPGFVLQDLALDMNYFLPRDVGFLADSRPSTPLAEPFERQRRCEWSEAIYRRNMLRFLRATFSSRYRRARNCSTVRPASRTIPPRVNAFTGL